MNLSTFDAFKHIKSDECLELSQSQLQQLQYVLLGIFDDIKYVCEKYGLTWTMGAGTALGTVRHQGFIPWDDDMDLNMPRRDYEVFLLRFQEEFGDKYWIHSPERTKNYGLLMGRIRLKGTTVKTREDFYTDECGAFVDIFVIENTFDNPVLRWLHGFFSLVLGFLLSCRKFYRDREQLMRLTGTNAELGRVFQTKIWIGRLLAWLPIDCLTHMADRWHSVCRNHDSRYVVIPSGRKHFFGELYLRSDMCKTAGMLFEGRNVKCPVAYGTYLQKLYGDYMKIPAPEDRETHVVYKPFDLGMGVKD